MSAQECEFWAKVFVKMYNITNNSTNSDHLEQFEHICAKFIPYAKERLGFDKPIGVEMVSDPENAKDPFGKTAYYDPNMMKITLFVDKRHIKDILRSLSHELVHHAQNCRGDFKAGMQTGPGYAQKDPHLRKLEAEAYEQGNGFVFRDFEDQYKQLTENLDHFLNLIKDERKSDIYLLRQNVTKENNNMTMKIKILKETLDLKHEGKPCDVVHKGQTHDEYQQIRLTIMTEAGPSDEEVAAAAAEAAPETKPAVPGADPTKGTHAARKAKWMAKHRALVAKKKAAKDQQTRDEIDAQIAALKKKMGLTSADITPAEKEVVEVPDVKGAAARKRAALAKHRAKVQTAKATNENWFKGNKDNLLFEELMKRWAK